MLQEQEAQAQQAPGYVRGFATDPSLPIPYKKVAAGVHTKIEYHRSTVSRYPRRCYTLLSRAFCSQAQRRSQESSDDGDIIGKSIDTYKNITNENGDRIYSLALPHYFLFLCSRQRRPQNWIRVAMDAFHSDRVIEAECR